MGAADRRRRGCRLCPYQLPVGYGPCAESLASDLLWRLAAGDCLMGVQLGLMGVQLGGKVIWADLRGCGCGAGTAGQQREAVHRASLMIKCSEAAAEVRPGPAAPFRLTALVVSAVHMPGPVRRARAVASFRLRYAGPAALVVLAWSGDRSPIRGCTTTSGDQVPPRTRISVRFPLNHALLEHVRWAASPHSRPGPSPRSRLLYGRQP
jgi:hypothetical protein